MCGRFALYVDEAMMRELYEIEVGDTLDLAPRYNIAPSQSVVVIVHDGIRFRAGMMRWGLIPSWANDTKMGSTLVNARAESIHEKPSFKKLIGQRRCVILASGFYDWKQLEDGKKQPMYIQLKSKIPMRLAGLWDRWERNGEVIQSCTIITTESNSFMNEIHHRMPVILSKDEEQTWLDRKLQDFARIKPLLKPCSTEIMDAYPVSTLVNSTKNESMQCIDRLAIHDL